jgi:hypothetical protein
MPAPIGGAHATVNSHERRNAGLAPISIVRHAAIPAESDAISVPWRVAIAPIAIAPIAVSISISGISISVSIGDGRSIAVSDRRDVAVAIIRVTIRIAVRSCQRAADDCSGGKTNA